MGELIKKYKVGLFLGKMDNCLRVCKSTALTLTMNAEIETLDFICDESPTDILKNYKVTIDQALSAYKGNSDYEFISGLFFNQSVGSSADCDAMIVFMADEGPEKGTFRAWKSKASIVISNYDAVAGVINFSINFGGTTEKGTATISNGKPTFTKKAGGMIISATGTGGTYTVKSENALSPMFEYKYKSDASVDAPDYGSDAEAGLTNLNTESMEVTATAGNKLLVVGLEAGKVVLAGICTLPSE